MSTQQARTHQRAQQPVCQRCSLCRTPAPPSPLCCCWRRRARGLAFCFPARCPPHPAGAWARVRMKAGVHTHSFACTVNCKCKKKSAHQCTEPAHTKTRAATQPPTQSCTPKHAHIRRQTTLNPRLQTLAWTRPPATQNRQSYDAEGRLSNQARAARSPAWTRLPRPP